MTHSIWHKLVFSTLLAVLALATGCGQKGDLYLPPEEVSQQK